MKELDEENLSTAIALGTAVCKELAICCSKRGRVIFQIYEKLEELKSANPVPAEGIDIGNSNQTEAEKSKDLSDLTN
jgi:hypothetical protein